MNRIYWQIEILVLCVFFCQACAATLCAFPIGFHRLIRQPYMALITKQRAKKITLYLQMGYVSKMYMTMKTSQNRCQARLLPIE